MYTSIFYGTVTVRNTDRLPVALNLQPQEGSFEIHRHKSVEEILPTEANSSSASQEFIRGLWRRLIPYLQESPVSVVDKTNAVHAFPSYLFRIHFNIILLRLDIPSGPFFQVFPPNSVRISFRHHACHIL